MDFSNFYKESKNSSTGTDTVLWRCRECRYEWEGTSPKIRIFRPYCKNCGSSNIFVKDWLIDKERWRKVRLIAFERAEWQCQGCGKKLNIYDPVHHLSYDNYYDVNKIVPLCRRCHYLVEGKDPKYISGTLLLRSVIPLVIFLSISGILLIIHRPFFLSSSFNVIISILPWLGVITGILFIICGKKMTEETRKVKKAIHSKKFMPEKDY